MSNPLNTVNGVSVTSATTSSATTSAGATLDKNAFLQLLAKQMQYQDPLSPQDNTAYVAQLAQYSTLEQMTNMNESMTKLSSVVGNIDQSVLVGQMSGMIGQTIQWTDDNKKTYSGKVLGVSISNNAPSIVAQAAGAKTSVSVPVGQITLVGSNASVDSIINSTAASATSTSSTSA